MLGKIQVRRRFSRIAVHRFPFRGIIRAMAHKFDPKHADKLEAEDFRKQMNPGAILSSLGLKPGDVFIDVGCGTGFYLRAAAEILKDSGSVYGIDSSRKMLKFLKNHTERGLLTAFNLVKSREYAVPLPDGIGTFALLSTVLHEVDEKVRLLGEIKRLLKPGGKLAVIEFEKTETPHGPPLHHRLSREDTAVWINQSGYSSVAFSAVNEELYACTAQST
ncbi:MAG: methyltransferase domain-containing protein [Spirochaetales bacterium]|nr:MAG: methyltransferase domain-containing protein [Spirochaetales bacterium]